MEIRFLGTGASEGVPVIGCDCAHYATAIPMSGPDGYGQQYC